MASVVDTSVKTFHDKMEGAPQLNGQPNSLNSMLYALLVTGFGLKTVTSITVSSGVATVLYGAPHAAEKDSVILIDGVTGPLTALNGEQKITLKPSPGELRFATSAPDGTAAGMITMKMAPLGWQRVWQDGNVSVFKSSDPMSNGHYLRVDDTDPIHVRVKGFETMSSVNVGTGQFPLASQIGGPTPDNGGYWAKSVVNGTNNVGWNFAGDTRFFMYAPQANQGSWPDGDMTKPRYLCSNFRGFGDPIALRPAGDPYGTVLGCGKGESHIGYPHAGSFSQSELSYGAIYSPRQYNGLGTSFEQDTMSYATCNPSEPASGQHTSALGRFPSDVDGGLRLSKRFIRSRITVTQADFAPRADIPGMAYIPQSQCYRVFPERSTVQGAGPWAGRTMMAIPIWSSYNSDSLSSPDSVGVILVDKTGPWRV